jgi:hypothetical protein
VLRAMQPDYDNPWSALTTPRCKCFSVLMSGNAIVLSLSKSMAPIWCSVAGTPPPSSGNLPESELSQRLT